MQRQHIPELLRPKVYKLITLRKNGKLREKANRPPATPRRNPSTARVCGATDHLSQHRGLKTDHLLQVPRPALRGGVDRQAGAEATTCFYPAPLSPSLLCPHLVKTPEEIRAHMASKNGRVSGRIARVGNGCHPVGRRASNRLDGANRG